MGSPRLPRIVAFDVDGTLLRGPTICQCRANGLGYGPERDSFERLTTREEIAVARVALCCPGMGAATPPLPAHVKRWPAADIEGIARDLLSLNRYACD